MNFHFKSVFILYLLFSDGLVSYDMPQGERRGSDINLLDFTYDGHYQDHLLTGGIGQLADGIEGNSNFR